MLILSDELYNLHAIGDSTHYIYKKTATMHIECKLNPNIWNTKQNKPNRFNFDKKKPS